MLGGSFLLVVWYVGVPGWVGFSLLWRSWMIHGVRFLFVYLVGRAVGLSARFARLLGRFLQNAQTFQRRSSTETRLCSTRCSHLSKQMVNQKVNAMLLSSVLARFLGLAGWLDCLFSYSK